MGILLFIIGVIAFAALAVPFCQGFMDRFKGRRRPRLRIFDDEEDSD